ncbi:hypothetical protein [Pseudomonas sp. KNUC1026]|uniref:hypothetical protein n=1 Tax=Pseudomonas sp. KNUC1026 TaxID=2893890 RepID=UPI001F21E2D2|nr:hypothetical protein [Pseudomonas sp. KNUC1026]UFH49559.1 hypothetical protein LN139_22620 [Pseudomonas sp. KNUC1026]
MKNSNYFSISWTAPIVPSISLAGIPLGIDAEVLAHVFLNYLIDASTQLYEFENAPGLRLGTHSLDEFGNGGYSFSLFDESAINKLLKGTPALSVMIRKWRVHAVKVYDFSFPGEVLQKLVYRGLLPEGIGLGDMVSSFLAFTNLDFDSAEDWFYTDQGYGGLRGHRLGSPSGRPSRSNCYCFMCDIRSDREGMSGTYFTNTDLVQVFFTKFLLPRKSTTLTPIGNASQARKATL